ncbi:hypothetical protein [Agrobacterium rosae]|uniref:hypothetical protein n=1 Tax=Agrobacterium rosae TaxID=1972867 RepID=UPI003CC7D189
MNGKKSKRVAHIVYALVDVEMGSLSWIRDRQLSSALRQCAPASQVLSPYSVQYRISRVILLCDLSVLLIPVLVTGIQPSRVCAAKRLFSAQGLGLAGFL